MPVARNIYGTSETAPGGGGECEAADGMHWMGQAAFLAEFVDPGTGAPVAVRDGVMAELGDHHAAARGASADPLPDARLHAADDRAVRVRADEPAPPRVLGRSDEMFIVRGINVFPMAVAAVVDEFRPQLSGEFRIVLDEPPPLVTPPRVLAERASDLASGRHDALAGELGARIRSILGFTARVEIVEPGRFPRGEQKTRHVLRGWLGES